MAHHSPANGPSPEILRQILGATKQFPQGKLDQSDEGEIRIAVGIAKEKVVIDFGTPVKWIGFTAEQAIELAESIRHKALSIQQENASG